MGQCSPHGYRARIVLTRPLLAAQFFALLYAKATADLVFQITDTQQMVSCVNSKFRPGGDAPSALS